MKNRISGMSMLRQAFVACDMGLCGARPIVLRRDLEAARNATPTA
jgi:predicted RecB family endonuclease